jgi:hypothetical protein
MKIEPPSYSTVRRYLNALPKTFLHHGIGIQQISV